MKEFKEEIKIRDQDQFQNDAGDVAAVETYVADEEMFEEGKCGKGLVMAMSGDEG